MTSFRAESESIFSSGSGAGAQSRISAFIDGPGQILGFDQQMAIIADAMLPENSPCGALPYILSRDEITKALPGLKFACCRLQILSLSRSCCF